MRGLLLVLAGFVGLAGSVTASVAQTQPQPAASTFDRVKTEGVLRIGVRHSAAPFSYFDDAGQPQGFSWELCKEIVKGLEADMARKLETKVTSIDLTQSFDKLADGSIDLQCGSTTRTAERQKRVQFSKTFFVAGIRVAYRKAEPDFAVATRLGNVIALENSTAAGIAKKLFGTSPNPAVGGSVSTVKGYDEGVAKLKDKQADLFLADAVLMPLDASIAFREKPLTVEPYALMMRLDDSKFSSAIDRHLIRLLATQADSIADRTGLKGKVNALTREVWKRPSSDTALSLY